MSLDVDEELEELGCKYPLDIVEYLRVIDGAEPERGVRSALEVLHRGQVPP